MSGSTGAAAGAGGIRSGTVTRLRRSGRMPVSSGAYVDEAERLLERSRVERSPAERITWAYRAALRGAGAVLEELRTGRRRRTSGSAWSRLRTAAPDMSGWVDRFEIYARFVARVEMGLETGLRDSDADNIYAEACEFIDEVRGKVGYLPEVA